MPSKSTKPTVSPVLRRRSPLIVTFIVGVVVLCLAIAAAAKSLIASFEQVEMAASNQKAVQIQRALEADLHQLAMSNRDYAEWDDAVSFLDSRDPKFIAANFIPTTFNGMHVDLVWIVDREGREVYSGYSNRTAAPIVSPAPRQFLKGLMPFVSDARHLMTLPAAERVLNTSRGVAAVSAIEITRSDRTERTGATMVFVRYIQDADLQRIRDTTQLAIEQIPLGPDSPQAAGLPQPVRQWIADPRSDSPTFVLSTDNREMVGYTLFRAADHAPAALFATRSPRDIFAIAYRQTWMMLGSILALFLIGGAAMLWMYFRLQRSLLAQLSVETRYRNIAEQLPEKIVVVDAITHVVQEANQAVTKFFSRRPNIAQTLTVQDIFPDITSEVITAAVESGEARRIVNSRAISAGADGQWADTEVAISWMEIEGRRMLTLVGHDVSHRKENAIRERAANYRLRQLAETDSLTGLPNRLFLHTKLPQLLKKLLNSDRLLALVYVDIDHFKNINDSRGHGVGDELLRTVAKRLKASVPTEYLVARMGGDEFVVVAPLMPDLASIEEMAVRLQTAVSTPCVLEEESVTVTASLGIAVYPRDGTDTRSLLKNSDIALYKAKEVGRHTHRFFALEMDRDVSQHVELEQALRSAINTDQIFMEYQPVIDLRTGRLSSLEALMRWRHPVQGLIPPAQFIPVAEKSGLIVELGQRALEQVFSQTRAWLEAHVPIVPIAVNVSPLQLNRYDFAALVLQLAGKARVDPRWLRFEITESAVLKEPERLIATLNSLRELGSQVLIDDFGTGYSSLSYLNRLPVDTLKIDQTFVRDLGDDTERVPIISAIIDMAKKLKLKTIAEGVETAEQAALLREQGCDCAQGYYFSRPVAARHCRPLLEELKREKPLTQTMLVRAISGGN